MELSKITQTMMSRHTIWLLRYVSQDTFVSPDVMLDTGGILWKEDHLLSKFL